MFYGLISIVSQTGSSLGVFTTMKRVLPETVLHVAI